MSISRRLQTIAYGIVLMTCAAPAEAQQPEMPEYIDDRGIIVAAIPDSSKYVVYSKHTGKWRTHRFPGDMQVAPIIGGSFIAFALDGRPVSELVAVDRQGNWRTMKLPKPTAKACRPVVSNEVAVYQVDGRAYAFSAITGTWDSVSCEKDFSIDNDYATIVTAERISAFSAITGSWATAELKDMDDES